jgi:hypothetical protein
MNQCAAVKKKGSTEPCKAKALRGHTLCGRHAKMKSPTLWKDAHKKEITDIVKFQAIVRGWYIRKYLKLCGKGVLRRKELVNDEDLMTFEEKDKQHPFDYFSIEENGKVWWFDFSTIYRWSCQSHRPCNPYSKTPMTIEDRKRLFELWGCRQRRRLSLPKESTTHSERLQSRWNLLCQIFENYGFSDLHPNMFANMAKINYYVMLQMVNDDVRVSVSDNSHYKERIMRLTNNAIRSIRDVETHQYIRSCLTTLLLMLSKPKDPYILVFTILSALHRC